MARPYLVVDTRETSLLDILDAEMSEPTSRGVKYAHIKKQITVGDYLICTPTAQDARILACIERKTLIDFAASLRDGRYRNTEKMLRLRDATNCRLFYLIEGPAFPSPSRKFSRIPFKSIMGAMTHLMIRDGIFVILSENEKCSASRLKNLLISYDILADAISAPPHGASAPALSGGPLSEPLSGGPLSEPLSGGPLSEPLNGDPLSEPLSEPLNDTLSGDPLSEPLSGGPLSEPLNDTLSGDPLSEPLSGPAVGGGNCVVPKIAVERTPISDADQVADIWCKLKGVSLVTAAKLRTVCSVMDVISRKIVLEELLNTRLNSGRTMIKSAARSLRLLYNGDHETLVRVLSGINGVSKTIAIEIAAAIGADNSLAELSNIQLHQKNRTVKLGAARSERILRLLNYRQICITH